PLGAGSGFESGDMKAMTQGTTIRPHGLGFDETYGLDHASGYLDAAAAGPVLDRSLHATGDVCPRCGEAFTAEDPVRRLASGELVHDVC
ncbi:MAG: hypothetical protein ACTHK4_04265, partial [Mycobacteriales bacterium]